MTQPSGASQRMRARGATCENFLYSFKGGLTAARGGEGRCGASGPRFAAVRALLAALTPSDTRSNYRGPDATSMTDAPAEDCERRQRTCARRAATSSLKHYLK